MRGQHGRDKPEHTAGQHSREDKRGTDSYSDSTGSSAKTQDYWSEHDAMNAKTTATAATDEKTFGFDYHSEKAVETQERYMRLIKNQNNTRVSLHLGFCTRALVIFVQEIVQLVTIQIFSQRQDTGRTVLVRAYL